MDRFGTLVQIDEDMGKALQEDPTISGQFPIEDSERIFFEYACETNTPSKETSLTMSKISNGNSMQYVSIKITPK
ncbi:696_t:CDS:2 [Diversispora eburnea]|uniref:696_t:CDS:1 n=1 Tax=Diversispora eburnea TaxID=1213867 RepID=A0A9N9BKV0_9GLOM|nr:696_t:CDS:2 [Diversispora eburnea]